ncbi:MAG: hypothetical protein GXP49_10640 [Deltaproteobacteria bacterium]|nr:hypothetical protein [Deltaproteobacteria bacterium]
MDCAARQEPGARTGPDPCASCDPAKELCRNDTCVPADEPDPCEGISCGVGRFCVAGACVQDPCFGVACPDGEWCVRDGQFVKDPCANMYCDKGEVCFQGKCVEAYEHDRDASFDTTLVQ